MVDVSSSLSSSSSSWEHEVFLCFRGEDTRDGFIGHLYQALIKDSNKINTFIDECLPKGRDILELLEKIKKSRIAVVVFSPNFASSIWCLDELAKIMECHKDENKNTAGHEVLPVFYKVAPTELRGPKGRVKEQLAKLGEEEDDPENVGRWKVGLEDLSHLKGWTYTQGKESGLLTQIVEEVHSRLDHTSVRVGVDNNGTNRMASRRPDIKELAICPKVRLGLAKYIIWVGAILIFSLVITKLVMHRILHQVLHRG